VAKQKMKEEDVPTNFRKIVTIASLNIASSSREELDIPLHTRLPFLEQLLCRPQFDILCLQEVRASGPLTASQVISLIQLFLGPEWEFYDQTANTHINTFHRTIFWNSSLLRHHHAEPYYISPQTHYNGSMNYFHLVVKSWFTFASSSHCTPTFSVLNVHAPMREKERIRYWKHTAQLMEPTSIVIGDLNKFESERAIYDSIFRLPKYDCILPNMETFVSFENDRQPSKDDLCPGELWRSSLDSVVLNTTYLQANIEIVSTEAEPRPTDHFLIVAHIGWAS
jgi:hypothetical protein